MLNLQQTTGETPKALLDRPKLNVWIKEYYKAFAALSDSRPISQGGVGLIPLSELYVYMQMFGINNPDERDKFTKMVKALDHVYAKHVNRKLKVERDKRTKTTPAKRSPQRARRR